MQHFLQLSLFHRNVIKQCYFFFQELLRDSQVHFLQLNSVEVATQLTLEDFSTFRQIEPTEYIDDLFEVNSKYGIPQLSKFAEVRIVFKNQPSFKICNFSLLSREKICTLKFYLLTFSTKKREILEYAFNK